MGNNTGNKDQKCEKPTFSDIVKGNDQKEVKNKTFNSHPNRSIGQAIANEEEDNISLISITTTSSSTTSSQSDQSESTNNTENVNKKEKNDGPLLLSANPYHEVVKKDNNRNKLPELPPQRIWDDDRAQNSQRNSNYHVTNSFPAFPQPTNHGVQFSSKIPTKQQNSDKPNTIREVSHQIISSGDCGEEILDKKAVYHDDFQVYHSSAYKRKMKN